MNAPAKVSADGQVMLPYDVQAQLGIGPGSAVIFRSLPDGSVAIEKAKTAPLPPHRFRELVGHAGPGLTTDEIMEMTRGD